MKHISLCRCSRANHVHYHVPCRYIKTAAYGHFGRTDDPEVFTWEVIKKL